MLSCERRKAVLPALFVRLVGTDMHSVANRTTTRQLSSSIFSGRVPSSPGGERTPSVGGGETSVDTQRNNGEPTTSPKDVKEKINYAGGTGPMIQTHIGESKTTSRESPSGSFSETLIVSSNGIVTRKDYLGQQRGKTAVASGRLLQLDRRIFRDQTAWEEEVVASASWVVIVGPSTQHWPSRMRKGERSLPTT